GIAYSFDVECLGPPARSASGDPRQDIPSHTFGSEARLHHRTRRRSRHRRPGVAYFTGNGAQSVEVRLRQDGHASPKRTCRAASASRVRNRLGGHAAQNKANRSSPASGALAPDRCSAGFAARARLYAELIKAICENACGKLPTRRFAAGSYSSDKRPRSLRSASNRSNKSRASSSRPNSTRLSTSQKLHARNTPS